MIRCNYCGAAQHPGTLFCTECGNFLLQPENMTDILPFAEIDRMPMPSTMIRQELKPGVGVKEILFIIPAIRQQITVPLNEQIRIGRADPNSEMVPELDLTKFDGVEYGVSRMHATIQHTEQGVILIDFGSTNGTAINNHRLMAETPYLLQSGDEIRFGDLLVHIFFE